LKVTVASLNRMRHSTGSQWSCLRSAVVVWQRNGGWDCQSRLVLTISVHIQRYPRVMHAFSHHQLLHSAHCRRGTSGSYTSWINDFKVQFLIFETVNVSRHRSCHITLKFKTSGYATWFTAGGAIRIAHYDIIDDIITRKL